MKREAFGHAKFRLVARDLGLPVFSVYGLVVAIWNTTAVRFPRGDIGRLTDEEIATEIEGCEIDPERLVEVLVRRRLLDRHPEHRLVVHDWHEHADDAVHYKLARAGVDFANGQPSKRAKSDGNRPGSTVGDSRRQDATVADGLSSPSSSPPTESEQVVRTLEAEDSTVAGSSELEPVQTGGEVVPFEPKPPKRRARKCPADFEPNDTDRETARELGFTGNAAREELAAFRDHDFGTAKSDWHGTFRNWLRRAARDRRLRPPGAAPSRPLSRDERTQAAFAEVEALDRLAEEGNPDALRG